MLQKKEPSADGHGGYAKHFRSCPGRQVKWVLPVGLLQFPANSPENADSCFLVTLQRVSLTDSRATQGGRTQCNCPIRKPIRSCCLLFPENSQHDLHGQHSCAILESVLLFGRTVYIGLAVAVIRNRRHGGKTVASRAVLCWGWDRVCFELIGCTPY